MSDSVGQANASGSSVTRVLGLVIPGIALVGLLGAYFYYEAQQSTPGPVNFLAHVKSHLNASTKLNADFTDADHDLVADPESEEAKQLDPEKLVFGVLGPDLEKEKERWADFLKNLETVTGKTVELESMDSGQPISLASSGKPFLQRAQDVREGRLHVVSMNTGAVGLYVNEGGVVPVCTMADSEGKSGYTMKIIASTASGIQSLEELRGRKFSFASLYSHSGFRAPLVALWKEFNLEPERDYQPVFEGNQEQMIKMVGQGKLAVAPVASDLLSRLEGRGDIKPDSYRVLYTSKEYPPACYGYAHQLKPELAEKIRKAFLEFDWAGTSLEKAYSSAQQSKFVPVSYKERWESVREIEQDIEKLTVKK